MRAARKPSRANTAIAASRICCLRSSLTFGRGDMYTSKSSPERAGKQGQQSLVREPCGQSCGRLRAGLLGKQEALCAKRASQQAAERWSQHYFHQHMLNEQAQGTARQKGFGSSASALLQRLDKGKHLLFVARRLMKEQDFFDERVAFEGKLVEVKRPVARLRVFEHAGQRQVSFLQRQGGRARCPELCVWKERVPRSQPPDVPGSLGNQIANLSQFRGPFERLE